MAAAATSRWLGFRCRLCLKLRGQRASPCGQIPCCRYEMLGESLRKRPLADFLQCVRFSLGAGELGTMEADAHAQFRDRVLIPARGAGVLEIRA